VHDPQRGGHAARCSRSSAMSSFEPGDLRVARVDLALQIVDRDAGHQRFTFTLRRAGISR
jgi:hypothetical protein